MRMKESGQKMPCQKLAKFCQLSFLKKGRFWKESLMKTSRMIFSLYIEVTQPAMIQLKAFIVTYSDEDTEQGRVHAS